MANTRGDVRQDERIVVVLFVLLLLLVVTAGMIWMHVFRLIRAEQSFRPMELELSVLELLPDVAQSHSVAAPSPVDEVTMVESVEPPADGDEEEMPATASTFQSRWTVAQLPTVVKRLPEEAPVVYLTFDDGPTKYLSAIVDVLIQKQVPATFFWIGQYAPPAPELLDKMRTAQLQVGSHTMNHQRLAGLSYAEQQREIQRSIDALAKKTGFEAVYVRPPYGAWDEHTRQVADDLGLKLVLWSVDPRDWEKGAAPDDIIEHVLSHLHPGAVILLHETEATLQALPTLIDRIRQNGYELAGLPRD